MTDQQIINHLINAAIQLSDISIGTGKASVQLGYHTDIGDKGSRYSFRLNDCSWKGPNGWGATPAEAFADFREKQAEAERQDAITAQVEQYRAELEKGVAS